MGSWIWWKGREQAAGVRAQEAETSCSPGCVFSGNVYGGGFAGSGGIAITGLAADAILLTVVLIAGVRCGHGIVGLGGRIVKLIGVEHP
jgi:hypothetical protein